MIVVSDSYASIASVLTLIKESSDRVALVTLELPALANFYRYYYSKHPNPKVCLVDKIPKVKHDRIVFFTRGFSGQKIKALQQLEPDNVLYYYSCEPHDMKESSFNLSVLRWKLLYGRHTSYGEVPQLKGFLYLSDKFMEKVVIMPPIKTPPISSMGIYTLPDYFKAVYFDSNLKYKGVDKALERVNKYFTPYQVAIKYHPGGVESGNYDRFGVVLPSYIPGEAVQGKNVKIYITIESTAIKEIKSGIIVSLLDLLPGESSKRQARKDLFLKLVPQIVLFPRTLEELECIIRSAV